MLYLPFLQIMRILRFARPLASDRRFHELQVQPERRAVRRTGTPTVPCCRCFTQPIKLYLKFSESDLPE